MLSRLKTRHIVGLVVAILLLSFQNCSQPLGKSMQETMQTYQSGLPFAFKANLDTVAYMSCSRMPSSYDSSAYFSLKAGAYRAGSGLGLTPGFINATKYYTQDFRATALSQADNSSGATMQLAVRKNGDYQSVLSGNGSAVNVGQDLGSLLAQLDVNPMASQLAAMNNGSLKNYFSGNANQFFNGTGLMETSLNYSQSETTMLSIRTNLQNRKSLLALTYTQTPDPASTNARGPYGAIASSAYGTGYFVNFKNPTGWPRSDQRVLSTINEFDLGGNTTGTLRSWSCPSNMQFIILRPEDVWPVGNILCNQAPDPTLASLTTSEQQVYTALRAVLPAGSWYVDMVNRCVVPKSHIATTSCYGDRTGLVAIDYTSTSCTPFNATTSAVGNCPHWLSMCIRQ